MLTALRTVGFAAWYRNWTGNQHIHAVAISDLDMATETVFSGVFDMREQIVGWAQGKDGVSAAVMAPMTIDQPQTWERYKRTHRASQLAPPAAARGHAGSRQRTRAAGRTARGSATPYGAQPSCEERYRASPREREAGCQEMYHPPVTALLRDGVAFVRVNQRTPGCVR